VAFSRRALALAAEMGPPGQGWAAAYLAISQHYRSAFSFTLAREYAMRGLALAAVSEGRSLGDLLRRQLGAALAPHLLGREEE
jgi:hypothetical protein